MFVDPKVIEFFAKEMILVQLNGDRIDTALARQYCVSGFPTLVMMDKDGMEIDRVAGYLPPEEFMLTFRNYAMGVGTIADMVAKSKDSTSRGYSLQIADRYKYTCDKAAAEQWYNRVIAAGDPLDSVSGECRTSIADMYARSNRFDDAIAAYRKIIADFEGRQAADDSRMAVGHVYVRAKKYDDAIAEFKQIVAEFKGKPLAIDADLNVGYVYRTMKDTAKAIAAYEYWLTTYPQADSSDIAYAKKQIGRLKNPPAPKPEEKK